MAKNKNVNPETEDIKVETAEETVDTAEVAAKEAAAAAAELEEADANAGKAKDELAELKDKYLRQAAEFDNYRKRTDREKSAMFDMGAMNVLGKLLPMIDNFERGLKDAPEDAFAEGMKMIYKDLMKSMEDIGVKPIEAEGKQFDPNYHNAVMHEEDDSGQENIVSEELQKGYMYNDNILRHSMVKVLN